MLAVILAEGHNHSKGSAFVHARIPTRSRAVTRAISGADRDQTVGPESEVLDVIANEIARVEAEIARIVAHDQEYVN